MVMAELKTQMAQVAERFNWQTGLAVGSALFAGIGINSQPAAAAQAPAPLYASADPFGTPGLSDSLTATASATAEECATEAMEPPKGLTGEYESYDTPNDNFYQIRFGLNSLVNCASEGKLKVTAFQQKQELGDGLHPKLVWTANGLSASAVTDQPKREDFVVRAVHECWPRSTGGYGNLDKIRHRLGRPAVRKTWTPISGPKVSQVFTGKAAPVCK